MADLFQDNEMMHDVIPESFETSSETRRDRAGIEIRIKDICQTRRRYGYRRVHVTLVREGLDIKMKQTYLIYWDLGLQCGNKTPKRRVRTKLRGGREGAVGLDEVSAMDHVHNQLATGKEMRVLTSGRHASALSARARCGSATGRRRRQRTGKGLPKIGYPKTVDQG